MCNACPHAMTAFDKAGDAHDDRKSSPQPIKRRCRSRCTDPIFTNCKQRGQSAAKEAGASHRHTHHHGISPAHSPEAAHGHCRARNDMAAALKTTSSLSTTFDRGDSPSSYPIGRARLELVRNRCPPLPLGCTQGSHCSGGAVVCCEPERARWHDRPVLGRWLGLTPERPSLCLRRRPEAAQGGPESG